MAKKGKPGTGGGFDVKLQFAPRIIAEHLGKQKYATSTKALGELVANAFDAGAKKVLIDLTKNDLGLPDSLTIADDGSGITPFDVKNRFGVVGVRSNAPKERLGRFGVGRLAVFRIGSISEWTTTSRADDGTKTRLRFTLRASAPDEFHVEETVADKDEPTGTRIQIFELLDSGAERLTRDRIAWDLIAEFCSYLFAHPNLRIGLNGEVLDLSKIVQQRTSETIYKERTRIGADATIHHILLKSAVSTTRLPANLLLTAKGVTVETAHLDDPPNPNYLGIVESPYLDEIVSSNRQAFVNMDGGFESLKDAVFANISEFGSQLRASEAGKFIERARQKDYYPFKALPQDALTEIEQTLYDRVLELLNVAANIEGMGSKQQQLVFDLVHRALGDENLLLVLEKVAALTPEDMGKFREVLERTTLQSIVRLASEVTERLTFLDVLHAIVYGPESEHLLERSQLHKFVEGNCWIFGPQFNLATSDKSFREIIRRHRSLADLAPVEDDLIEGIDGVNKIPDLFLAAAKDYPVPAPERSHHHVLVELKKPTVTVGQKEMAQLSVYGNIVAGSSEFDQNITQWDLFLVSCDVKSEIERQRRQKGYPFGCVLNNDGLRQWVFTWGEIIDKARQEMLLVRQHLERKSQELSASDYLKQRFPDAFGLLKA